MTTTLVFSTHARARMAIRGISVSEVEQAVKQGSKELQKPDKVLYHFRHFIVVTKRIGEKMFVITVKPRW